MSHDLQNDAAFVNRKGFEFCMRTIGCKFLRKCDPTALFIGVLRIVVQETERRPVDDYQTGLLFCYDRMYKKASSAARNQQIFMVTIRTANPG